MVQADSHGAPEDLKVLKQEHPLEEVLITQTNRNELVKITQICTYIGLALEGEVGPARILPLEAFCELEKDEHLVAGHVGRPQLYLLMALAVRWQLVGRRLAEVGAVLGDVRDDQEV